MSIYLDNSATTCISDEVFESMLPFLKDKYGNPGSIYSLGREAAEAVKTAREQVAALFHTTPGHIIFTGSGSEANNLAIRGFHSPANCHKTLLYSAVEHESVIKAAESALLEGKFDAAEVLPVTDKCEVLPSTVESRLSDTIGMLAVMAINNEVGTANNIELIGDMANWYFGTPFHVDCVQAAGVIDINVDAFQCTSASISSHKIHGPKGVGALYLRSPVRYKSLIAGGASQEFGLRGGTENVAGIVGFGKACEIALGHLHENSTRIDRMCNRFCGYLRDYAEKYGILDCLFFNSSSNIKIVNFGFKGIDAQTLILMLDAEGVYVSAGSACSSRENKPSHVLKAMGLTDDEARQSIRVSFDPANKQDECKKAAMVIAKCAATLKTMSAG